MQCFISNKKEQSDLNTLNCHLWLYNKLAFEIVV